MRRWMTFASLGWISAAMAPAMGAPTITSLEVTQGIQRTSNDIPLVAGRSTTVRVLIDPGPTAVSGIQAALHIQVNGTLITPPPTATSPGGLIPGTPFTARPGASRSTGDGTLNFDLPPAICSQLLPGTKATFKVEILPAGGSTMTVPDLDVVAPLQPIIYCTAIHYLKSTAPPPDLKTLLSQGTALLLALYPVADADPALLRNGGILNFAYARPSQPTKDIPVINDGKEKDQLFARLESWLSLHRSGGAGRADNEFIYGWASCPVESNGWSRQPGFTGFGNMDPAMFQRTFVHEMGHMLGFDHPGLPLAAVPNDRISETGWDTQSRFPGNRAKPGGAAGYFDVMAPNHRTSEAWIDPVFYEKLQKVVLPTAAGGDVADYVIQVQGSIEESDDRRLTVELFPAFRIPWRMAPTRSSSTGRFVAEVTTSDENVVQRRFDAGTSSEAGTSLVGAFSVRLPIKQGSRVTRMRILEGNEQLAVLKGTGQPPQVDIVFPVSGAKLPAASRVEWRAFDPDSKELSYQVAYSPDGGQSFIPVSVDQDEMSVDESKTVRVQVDTSVLPRGPAPLFLVLACDGLNTSPGQVTGFSFQ